ncbi:hypothetical protein HRR83_009119 [Exophiala dermatitidis]|uniref:Uncharacterized protein n=1 Tax=Exophiala dermatitidis TaxID=5970 RepID=A0AAN6ENH3_EXODE|nr:hypothetical protein HRR74_009050 [Exophiala dermatitidis]KAJ4504826.1 hypothetical protein HRR73_008580 [Exophiala dermatitidis]KAJ4530717.1 hypothetical protein HRR76_008415 [Exophiala dermatitidis]KAJ4531672.1 hypothetical protein HRR77_009218 [Exophiala dermatitidis]KAJ4556736.1 hypothetical protein HRR79_008909 [Exophiala dermatitidis]
MLSLPSKAHQILIMVLHTSQKPPSSSCALAAVLVVSWFPANTGQYGSLERAKSSTKSAASRFNALATARTNQATPMPGLNTSVFFSSSNAQALHIRHDAASYGPCSAIQPHIPSCPLSLFTSSV